MASSKVPYALMPSLPEMPKIGQSGEEGSGKRTLVSKMWTSLMFLWCFADKAMIITLGTSQNLYYGRNKLQINILNIFNNILITYKLHKGTEQTIVFITLVLVPNGNPPVECFNNSILINLIMTAKFCLWPNPRRYRLSREIVAYIIPQETKHFHAKFYWNQCSNLPLRK